MIKVRKTAAAVEIHPGRNAHNCCVKAAPT